MRDAAAKRAAAREERHQRQMTARARRGGGGAARLSASPLTSPALSLALLSRSHALRCQGSIQAACAAVMPCVLRLACE